MRPRLTGGLVGMLVVAALYVAHAQSVQSSGRGLSAAWLLVLLLPGVAAGALAYRRGMQSACEKEGALAGLITAHFAATLLITVLVIAVLNLDWARYTEQVGPQVAGAVREAAFPATLAVAAATVVVTYAGCITAGWLGAAAVGALVGRRQTTDHGRRVGNGSSRQR
jgi:hypothetical protein